jgi:hypothetical protein
VPASALGPLAPLTSTLLLHKPALCSDVCSAQHAERRCCPGPSPLGRFRLRAEADLVGEICTFPPVLMAARHAADREGPAGHHERGPIWLVWKMRSPAAGRSVGGVRPSSGVDRLASGCLVKESAMDPARLDTLARTLATTSRRKMLTAAVASALLALLGGSRAAAERKPTHCAALGKHCGANKGCCDADAACHEGTCQRCTAETEPCTDDAGCCGGVCCLGLDPDGACCASRERCCGGHCCVGARQVCDVRFTMCVTCRAAGEFCNELIVCCPGLRCDVSAGSCVPA